MRKLLVGLVLVFAANASAVVSVRATGAYRGADALCNTTMYPPSIGSPVTPSNTAATSSEAVGQLLCGRFVMPCTMRGTRMGFVVTTQQASSSVDAGIYDATTGTLLAHTGPLATTGTGAKTTTGLAFLLKEGGAYWACTAQDVTGGALVLGGENFVVAGVVPTINVFDVNIGSGPNSGSSNLAQFNRQCSGSGNPYTCCTGSGTGTCTGLPSVLPTISVDASPLRPAKVAISP